MSVNTRLFYGVGQETKTEKSKYAYKLKVGYICLISVGVLCIFNSCRLMASDRIF